MKKTLIIIGVTIGAIVLIAIMVYFGNEYWIREKPKYNEIAYKIEEKENEIVETVYYPETLNPTKVINIYNYEEKDKDNKLKKVTCKKYFKNIVSARVYNYPIQNNNRMVIEENIIIDNNVNINSISAYKKKEYVNIIKENHDSHRLLQ